jgi:hypothetical protein
MKISENLLTLKSLTTKPKYHQVKLVNILQAE